MRLLRASHVKAENSGFDSEWTSRFISLPSYSYHLHKLLPKSFLG